MPKRKKSVEQKKRERREKNKHQKDKIPECDLQSHEGESVNSKRLPMADSLNNQVSVEVRLPEKTEVVEKLSDTERFSLIDWKQTSEDKGHCKQISKHSSAGIILTDRSNKKRNFSETEEKSLTHSVKEVFEKRKKRKCSSSEVHRTEKGWRLSTLGSGIQRSENQDVLISVSDMCSEKLVNTDSNTSTSNRGDLWENDISCRREILIETDSEEGVNIKVKRLNKRIKCNKESTIGIKSRVSPSLTETAPFEKYNDTRLDLTRSEPVVKMNENGKCVRNEKSQLTFTKTLLFKGRRSDISMCQDLTSEYGKTGSCPVDSVASDKIKETGQNVETLCEAKKLTVDIKHGSNDMERKSKATTALCNTTKKQSLQKEATEQPCNSKSNEDFITENYKTCTKGVRPQLALTTKKSRKPKQVSSVNKEIYSNVSVPFIPRNEKAKKVKQGLIRNTELDASFQKKMKLITGSGNLFEEIQRQTRWSSMFNQRAVQKKKIESTRSDVSGPKVSKCVKSLEGTEYAFVKQNSLKEMEVGLSKEDYLTEVKNLLNKEDYRRERNRLKIQKWRKSFSGAVKRAEDKNRKRQDFQEMTDEEKLKNRKKVAERVRKCRLNRSQTKNDVVKHRDRVRKVMKWSEMRESDRDIVKSRNCQSHQKVRSEMDETQKSSLRLGDRNRKAALWTGMDETERDSVRSQNRMTQQKVRSQMEDTQKSCVRLGDRNRKKATWTDMDETERESVRSQNRLIQQKIRSQMDETQKSSVRLGDRNRKAALWTEMGETERDSVRSQNRLIKHIVRSQMDETQKRSLRLGDRNRKKATWTDMDETERDCVRSQNRLTQQKIRSQMEESQKSSVRLGDRNRKKALWTDKDETERHSVRSQNRLTQQKVRSQMEESQKSSVRLGDRNRKKAIWTDMDETERDSVRSQNRLIKHKVRSQMDETQKSSVRLVDRNRKKVLWTDMDETEREGVRSQNRLTQQKVRSKLDIQQKSQQREKNSKRIKEARLATCNSKQTAVETFRTLIKSGPVYVCTCCHRLMYRENVLLYSQSSYQDCDAALMKCSITGYLSVDKKEYICKTCNWNLKRNRLPAQAVGNNLQLDEIPVELNDLSTLESSLISKRLPFMKVLALPRGKQRAIHGCVINVPVNPEETCSILPRLPSSSSVITVKLKRKLCYRGHVIKQTVRPWKVLQALHYLKYTEKNPHYSDVAINEHWDEDAMGDNQPLWESMTSGDVQNDGTFHMTENVENDIEKESTSSDNELSVSKNHNHSDDENDDRSHLTGLPFDTCLQPKDMSSDKDFLLSIAPGEGKKPVGIYSDKSNEELAFPTLFPSGDFGYDCRRVQQLSMKKYFNARILNVDGRFAKSTEYLFYAQYRCEAKDVADCLSISLRKCKSKCQQDNITASKIKDIEEMRKLIRNDLNYHFLQKVRGSPAYFNKLLYDLLGMVRQLGNCTWFLTLSAADLKWTETIQIIAAQFGQVLSQDDVNALTWEQKCMWLRSNPVTAARQFDFRLQTFMKTLIIGEPHTIGEVQDYKYRIEFQQRGSPHAHMLIWIKDAPQIDESSSEEVTKFVDMHVSCSIASDNEELAMLVQTLQKHSHSPACRKQGKTCRFSFPRPPIEETTVFMPPETPVTDSNKTVYCDVLTDVQEKLSSLQHETELTLSELLKDLKVPDGLYKRALQWIKTKQGRPSVVIKRKPNEGFINNYNPHILQAWQANMDIQFVDHVQACVMYVSSYISKPEKTLGDVLKSVSKTCEPQGPKRMMETVAKKFLSHREVSAQEAVYRLLSLPLIKGSRQILFVPTDLPDHRTKLFKPLKVIQELDDDDEDLYLSGIIDKYEERSPSLDNICLADFAAYYTYSRSKKNSEFNEDVNTDVDQDCEQIDEVATFPKTIILQNSGTKLTKRARPAIIRTHQFSQDRQEEQFHHSKLLLYYPWRNEEIDLKAEDGLYKTKYMREFEKFAAKLCEYEPNAEEFRQAFEDLQQNGPPEDAWATLAPETEQQQAEDVLHGTENDPEYEALAPHTQMEPRDLGIIQCEYEHQTRLVSNPKWLDMISSLNDEQKKVHQFILEWCIKMSMTNKTKERPPPFHLFLTGGAGVGKSHVVKTVVQTAKRLLNVGQGEDEITVMVCAFTGAAAFNVEGHTLHSAFHLPVGESKQDDYIRLSNEQLAAMRSKLGSLCILIIDEISMVGTDQLLTIHRRLAEVMTSDDPFGGVSILAVGDLFQLPPVGHTPVFEAPKDPVVAALYGSLWKKHFKFIELKEVMRQKEDSQFANTLNRFRLNQQTEEDMLLIQSRQVETNDVTYPVGALHIFAFNKEVDRHNSRMLQNLNVPTITIVAVDSKKDQQTGRVAMASHGAKESGVLKELKLAVGARVMMTTNVNVDDGLVNSAAGTVTGFLPTPPAAQDPEFSSYKPKYVLVHFDDARVGEATRAKLKKMIPDQVSTPVSQAEVLVKKRKISGKRIQFPLTLAWGITIHKSQGRTVEELVVSTSGSFKCGQMYTALSRVKSLEGLHILGDFQKNQVKTDERSIQELQRLIQRSKFKMEVPEAVAVSSELYFKLSLININSLKPHHKSLSEDTNISGSSIIALTETWLKNTDSSDGIMISDDYGLLRKDHYSARGIPQGGIALNIHKDFLIVRDLRYRVAQLQYLCILLSDRRDRDTRLLIVVIYNPPAVPAAVFLKQLDSLLCHIPCDSVTTILCGDFNIDGAGESKQSKDLEKVTSHYGFHQFVSAPTHKRGSTLDHVYINRNIQQSVLVSCIPVHYSDHFHVLLSVPYRCLLGSRY